MAPAGPSKNVIMFGVVVVLYSGQLGTFLPFGSNSSRINQVVCELAVVVDVQFVGRVKLFHDVSSQRNARVKS